MLDFEDSKNVVHKMRNLLVLIYFLKFIMMFAVDWNICYNHALIAFIFLGKK